MCIRDSLFSNSFYSLSGAMGTQDAEINALAAVRQPLFTSALCRLSMPEVIRKASKPISRAMVWVTISPVSYTHLDVYKRQTNRSRA